MLRENIPLRAFRLTFFPLLFAIEISLSVLFLVMRFYVEDTGESYPGYTTVFGWIIASLSIIIAVGATVLFLSAFELNENKVKLLYDAKKLRILTFGTIFTIFLQIVSIGSAQVFYIPLSPYSTSSSLIIISCSLLLPILLYFASNSDSESQELYALSEEAPLRIKLTAFWLLFLTGAMQTFATDWGIIIIGLILLVSTYFFFLLYRFAAILTPIVLIIHGSFSAVITIASFVYLDTLVANIKEMNYNFNQTQAIIIIVIFFIIPGLISFLLAQSFFRRWVINWIREARPEEKEIEMDLS